MGLQYSVFIAGQLARVGIAPDLDDKDGDHGRLGMAAQPASIIPAAATATTDTRMPRIPCPYFAPRSPRNRGGRKAWGDNSRKQRPRAKMPLSR
jgi:hypothetical protein